MKVTLYLCAVIAFATAIAADSNNNGLRQTSQLRLSGAISDNMVLQRDSPSRVWGFATAGWTVYAQLTDSEGKKVQMVQSTADAEGKWVAEFDAQAAGGPYKIYFAAGEETATVSNVMFGDVFLCSGQSNMEFAVASAYNAEAELEDAANYPNLRLFTVKKTFSNTTLDDVGSQSDKYVWGVSGPETVGESGWAVFSAVCYFFGRDLMRQNPEVPIGLVGSFWGGTAIQVWSSPEVVNKCDPNFNPGPPQQWPTATAELYNAMIHPILNMNLRGITWYQGESNAWEPPIYGCLIVEMVKDWRAKFGGDIPFFYVELSGYYDSKQDFHWPTFRIVGQRPVLELPLTGFATAMDLGDPTSPAGAIHPRNKQEVGRRLALQFRTIGYGEKDVESFGPTPSDGTLNMNANTREVTVPFTHADGLNYKNTEQCWECCQSTNFPMFKLKADLTTENFEIPSDIRIEGSSVVLTFATHASVPGETLWLAYADQDYPQCALFNSQGIAGSGFVSQVSVTDTLQ